MEKFNAKRCTYDGYSFDSKSEMRRYQELKLLDSADEIRELEVHPKLLIIPAYQEHPAVYYKADFSYVDRKRKAYVYEDVKPFKRNAKGERVPYLTREFILKWKMAQYCCYKAANGMKILFEVVEA